MHRIRTLTVMAATLAAAVTLLPDTAQAKRKSPLEGKPVVVRKLELHKLRFGITPFVGMSLSQAFVHKGYAGARLHFDITDWIGLKGMFAYGVINKPAKLLRGLVGESEEGGGSLPVGIPAGTPENDTAAPVRDQDAFNNPAPLLHDFKAGLTRNNWLASLDVVFTPFSGKLGLFSGIFTEYDLYLFGGLGLSSFGRQYPGAKSTNELLGNLDTTDSKAASYCRSGQRPGRRHQPRVLPAPRQGRHRHQGRPELRRRHPRVPRRLGVHQHRCPGHHVLEQPRGPQQHDHRRAAQGRQEGRQLEPQRDDVPRRHLLPAPEGQALRAQAPGQEEVAPDP
jgi:hypothetical protein